MNIRPTSRRVFYDGTTRIQVDVEDSERGLFWQMQVGEGPDAWSEVTNHYQGILVHKGYGYASAYWDGVLPIERPFRITPVAELK